jgi:hypothetical protein
LRWREGDVLSLGWVGWVVVQLDILETDRIGQCRRGLKGGREEAASFGVVVVGRVIAADMVGVEGTIGAAACSDMVALGPDVAHMGAWVEHLAAESAIDWAAVEVGEAVWSISSLATRSSH